MKNSLTISNKTKLKTRFRLSLRYIQYSQIAFNILFSTEAAAITKTTVSSGNWNNSSIWSPAGVPSSNDGVIISSNNIINLNADGVADNITISQGGSLIGISNVELDISGNATINGSFDMNSCDIKLAHNGAT